MRTGQPAVDRDRLPVDVTRLIAREEQRDIGKLLGLRRAAEPEEIAVHAAWLCSDANTYLTGQVVTVDGGLTVTF